MDNYKFLNPHFDLVKRTIEYFFCYLFDDKEYKEIQEIAMKYSERRNDSNAKVFLGMHYLSVFDFQLYLSEKKLIGGGIATQIIERTLDILVQNNALSLLTNELSLREKRYRPSNLFSAFLFRNKLNVTFIHNLIFGWQYIINYYSNSVIKIENTTNKEISIGTGFYLEISLNNVDKYLIVTNKHVLENADNLRVLFKDESEIKISETYEDTNRDIGFIEVEKSSGLHIT